MFFSLNHYVVPNFEWSPQTRISHALVVLPSLTYSHHTIIILLRKQGPCSFLSSDTLNQEDEGVLLGFIGLPNISVQLFERVWNRQVSGDKEKYYGR